MEGKAVGTVLTILVLCGFLFAACFAPCSWYGCAPAKDVPGRCIKQMVNP